MLIRPKLVIDFASMNFIFLMFQTPSRGMIEVDSFSPYASFGAGSTRPVFKKNIEMVIQATACRLISEEILLTHDFFHLGIDWNS